MCHSIPLERWIERSLREVLGEGRQPPMPITQVVARGNDFIQKLKEATDNPARNKAKGKAKAKSKSKTFEDPLACVPKHKTYEEAVLAAQNCGKCIAQKDGTKGCRACMGEFFELQRKKGHKARDLKNTFEDLAG